MGFPQISGMDAELFPGEKIIQFCPDPKGSLNDFF